MHARAAPFEDEVNDGEFIDCGNVSSDQRIKPINGNVRAAPHVVCLQAFWLTIDRQRYTISPEHQKISPLIDDPRFKLPSGERRKKPARVSA